MADIAINPVTRRVQFTGNTGTGPFAFTFNILADADIAVYKNTTLLTLTTHYTVTTNANGTGSITLDAGQALISSDVLTIIGGRDLSRTTDFVTAGDLLASSLNEQLDSLVIMTQQLDEKVGRTIKTNPGDVYTDLELPTKDNRKGTVLGFNATSGDPEVGPTIADVSSLASITADIATLADIEDGTDATDAIQTVAGISSNVSTVAGISSNVTTVAGNTSNINAVVADEADIGTVAGSISNVNTVAGIDSNITTVAGNTTNINTVAGNNSNITTVAGISANVTTVAGISSDVTTVAGISSDVTTVAADGTDIGTVATNIADVNTVASNIATISAKVSKSGDTMTGDLTIQGNLTVSGTTITVDSATAQTIDLGDGDRMRFGDSNDAYIEWNGTYFDARSTGRFDLLSSGNDLRLSTGTNVGLIVNHTGGTPAVQLYNSGVQRLATTSTGIDVTGTVTADGLIFDQNFANPTNTTATVYNQSGVGPTMSGYKNEFRTGTTPVSRLEISNNGDISFYEDTGTTAKFFWDASAESLGIGTSSPSAPLHINGGSANVVLKATNSSNTTGLFVGARDGAFGSIFSAGDGYIYQGNGKNLSMTADGGGVVRFGTGSTERMRIDSSGNVGIGTSSPDARLHIEGQASGSEYAALKLSNNVNADGSGVSLEFADVVDLTTTKITSLRTGTSYSLQFFTTSSSTLSEKMRITGGGNVGIGTTSPLQALHVNSGTGNSAAIFESTDATSQIWLKDSASSSTYQTGIACYGDNLLLNNGGERMRIDSSGNLLVGTTSTDYNSYAGVRVSQSGNLRSTASSDSALLLNRLTSDGNIAVFRKDGTTVGSIGYESSGLYIDGEDSHAGLSFGGNSIAPRDGGTRVDNIVDVGSSTYRFKDLYLSGGVYLGGTGAANKLDDYEEGTWTPILTFGGGTTGITYTQNDGWYTKIGRLVVAGWEIVLSNKGTSTGSAIVKDFPFTIAPTQRQSCSTHYFQFMSSSFPTGHKTFYGTANSTIGGAPQYFTGSSGTSSSLNNGHFGNSSYWYGVYTYYTN